MVGSASLFSRVVPFGRSDRLGRISRIQPLGRVNRFGRVPYLDRMSRSARSVWSSRSVRSDWFHNIRPARLGKRHGRVRQAALEWSFSVALSCLMKTISKIGNNPP